MDNEGFLGPLTEFIPHIPNAVTYLDQITTLDLSILERVHVQDLVVSEDEGQPSVEFALAIEGETRLDVPGLSFITLYFGATIPGYTFLRSHLVIGPNGRLRLYDFQLAVEIHQPLLKRYDLESDTIGDSDLRFEIDAGISVNTAAELVVDLYDFNIPPFAVGDTGLILTLENCNLDLGGLRTPAELLDYVSDPQFNGIFADTALLYWLPQFTVPFAPFKGLRLLLNTIAIDQNGVGFGFDLQWNVVHDGQTISRRSEFTGFLFDDRLGVAIESATGRVAQNVPQEFAVSGVVQLPFFPTLVSVEFGLAANVDTGKFQTSLMLTKLATVPLVIELGSSGQALTIEHLSVEGELRDDGFTLDGSAGFTLQLPGFTLNVEYTDVLIAHTPEGDSLHFNLRGVELGLLGTVEQATLKVNTERNASGDTQLKDFFIEAILHSEDTLERLNLDQLPAFMPRPPDDALLSALFTWDTDQWKLRFSAALTDVDNLWPFVPPDYRPEVRSAEFVFEALQKETDDTITGEVSLSVSLRLPEIVQSLGGDVLSVTTGDADGWINTTAKARIEQSTGSPTESHLDFVIANAVGITLQIPGLAQDEPPVAIQITSIDFDIGNAAETSGHFKIAGDFVVRPIEPPIGMPLAASLRQLMAPVSAAQLGGTATAELEFDDDKAKFELQCIFADTQIEIDLFDMMTNLAGSIAAPEGLDEQNGKIDLDLEVGFNLRRIALQLGSLGTETASQLSLDLHMGLSVLGIHTEFEFKLSDQQVTFGFKELAIPIKFPALPMRMEDLNQLRGAGGHWNKHKWLTETEPQLDAELTTLTQLINGYQAEISLLEQELNELDSGPERTLKQTALKQLKERSLPEANEQSLHLSAKRFLLDAIFVLHDLMSTSANRSLFQQYVEAYQTVVDSTIGAIQLDTELLFVLSNVKFVLPFDNPSDIRVEGGAQLAGFSTDSLFAPLGDLVFKLGLSSEYIFFSVEGGGDPIPLPEFGRYTDGSVNLKHIRIGYGYTKNSFAMAFAGELKLPEALVEDADTSNTLGVGIRLPVQTRLAFSLDLIPVVLGEVDFVIPLPKFDIDLRQPDTPGLIDSRVCRPAWDGLQLIIPNVTRWAFKKARFSPFFGPIPAPNFNFSYDYTIGPDGYSVTMVCDNYLVISPVLGQYPVPFIADATPFFDNLCTNVSIAGFGVNFNLQRPFPSLSPMAIFEVMGLLSDPGMPIDPNGALAGSMRATIEHAYITLPPYVVRMFPELGNVVEREVNYTLNLGTVISVAQTVTPWLQEGLKRADEAASNAQAIVEDVINNPPDLSPAALLGMLPQSMRCLHLEGSFGGFDASAVIALMTQTEAYKEFDRRDSPPVPASLTKILDDSFATFSKQRWKIFNQGHRRPAWHAADGNLMQTSDTHRTAKPLLPGTFILATDVHTQARMMLHTVVRSKRGGIGVMFAVQDEKNYYRFAIYDKLKFELVKVQANTARVLFAAAANTERHERFTIAIQMLPANVTRRSTRRGRPGSRATRATGQRIRITVNGLQWCNFVDTSKPFKQGTVGLYSWKNSRAQFECIRVSAAGKSQKLVAGEPASAEAAFAWQPKLPSHEPALFNPNAPENNIFAHEAFAGFDALVLDAIEQPSDDAVGIITAAQISVFDLQAFRFFGLIFSDGRFSLLSETGIPGLALRVAGISVSLPLSFQSRLVLKGQSRGANTHASIRGEGWADWHVIPGVVQIKAGSATAPIALELQSDARFAISGSGSVEFFGDAAALTGQFDISQTHCFMSGDFGFAPNFFIGRQRVIDLQLATTGRVGPGPHFEFAGNGQLSILGNPAVAVEGRVSDKEIALSAELNLPAWNGLPIDELELAVQGVIEFGDHAAPNFLLEGRASFKGLSTGGNNGLEISGQGGIRARNGHLMTYLEGGLRWQNRDWLRGRIELGTEGVRIEGATSFALDILDLPDNLNTQLASLYFTIDIGGQFGLNKSGRLTDCGLQCRWMLAIKLPGSDQQLLPVAMQSIDFNLNNLSGTHRLVKLIELLKFDSLSVLPVDGITIPVPEITPTSYAGLYRTTVNYGGGSQNIPMLKQRATAHPDEYFRLPTSIGIANKTINLDLGPVASGLGIPDPSFTVKAPSLNNYRSFYPGSATVSFPSVPVPQISTSNSSGAVKIFEVPSAFEVEFSNQSLSSILENLNCTLSLGWKDLDLGIVVTRNKKDKFMPFRKMFG